MRDERTVAPSARSKAPPAPIRRAKTPDRGAAPTAALPLRTYRYPLLARTLPCPEPQHKRARPGSDANKKVMNVYKYDPCKSCLLCAVCLLLHAVTPLAVLCSCVEGVAKVAEVRAGERRPAALQACYHEFAAPPRSIASFAKASALQLNSRYICMTSQRTPNAVNRAHRVKHSSYKARSAGDLHAVGL